MEINKKISVCVLTYNRLDYLKKTIDSVLNSNCSDYDLYVFNDCSTDGTKNYLDKLQNENVLTAINHQKNIGLGSNANYVIDNIKSKYCLMLHDDDTIEPDYLKETLLLIESDKEIAMVGTGWNIIDRDGLISNTLIYKEFDNNVILSDWDYFNHHINGLQFPWSGTLFRMDKIIDLRFRFDEHPICADIIFMGNLVNCNKVGYIPKTLMNYRNHAETVTNKSDFSLRFNEWESNFIFYEGIIKKYGYGREVIRNHRKATTKTLVFLMLTSPNFKYFFKALASKYFCFSNINLNQFLKIIKKFLKLMLRIT